MKPSETVLETVPEGEAERTVAFRLTPPRLPFGKSTRTPVPFDEWTMTAPEAARPAVAHLLQAWGDGETGRDGAPLVLPEGDGVRLHADLVARLSDPEAVALGLPPAARLSLNLQSIGVAHQPDFRIDARWTRPNGLPAATQRRGARITTDGKDWRIPEPIWSTLAAVDRLNAASDDSERQNALAALRAAIGDEDRRYVRPDGFIERLRLSYAAGFSLELKPSASGLDFDPVLFSPERLREAEDGAALDEAADSLLPPAQQLAFARRFRAGDGSRRAYLLDDGVILYVDPALQQALKVVRAAQAAGPEARRDFARAPQRKLREALGEEDAPALFVETEQFSERVLGIDVWRKPVLPWIKPRPNGWLPESFGLWIGEPPEGVRIEVTPEELPTLSAALDTATREDCSTFLHQNVEIPATERTRAAIDNIAALVGAAAEEEGEAGPASGDAPPALAGRYFLQVRDNLEDVAYAPVARAAPATLPPPEFPINVRTSPKPHQVDGFAWLARCWRAGTPGALLADDMGLGKTFQALAFLAWLRVEAERRPILIVAPTGLLANWRAEIERHLEPDALGRIVSAYGAELRGIRTAEGRDIEIAASALDLDHWQSAGVVLTTYETMRDYHLSFARTPFAAIVWDEVQKLKNPASQMTRAAKTLNARFQLAMTGTPVENRLQDLWSIYDVVHPGLLGSSRTFESAYPASEPDKLKALHELLASPQEGRPPLLLRRMKDDCLAGLPAKHIHPLPTPMPERQADAYNHVIRRAFAARGSGRRGAMLEILHHLRGVSLHPVPPEQAGAGWPEESARLQASFTLLDRIHAAGEKVLIFCESLAMQALLAGEIRRRYGLRHEVARIHGGVGGEARQGAVDTFQARGPGFDAMILSPKAGGVGLTLTAANHVIHLSRWWNPAVEDQATDRAFRIGQTKDVHVYLPQAVHPDPSVGPSSFDLKLDALMARKRELSRGLLIPGESESDLNQLLDDVLAEPGADELAPAPVQAAQRGVVETPPAPRATLTIARPPPTQPAVANAPRRVSFVRGGRRDFSIFTVPLIGRHVRELVIRDPYACARPENREVLVDFVALLGEAAAAIGDVTVTAWDADSANNPPVETDRAQRTHLETCWRGKIARPELPRFIALSRRSTRGFHDRAIIAHLADGSKIGWDVSNGLDGVMRDFKECVINRWEE